MPWPQLDHIVIRMPDSATPADLLKECWMFKRYFTITPGGIHTDGKTQNMLISLADGVYLELRAFTTKRIWDRVARKPISLSDFAFLDRPVKDAAQAWQINNTRESGRGDSKWIIIPAQSGWVNGILGFCVEDITGREGRVPSAPEHPSGVKAIKKITILQFPNGESERTIQVYRDIIGQKTIGTKVIGPDEIYVGTPNGGKVEIEIREARTKEEREALKRNQHGIYKVEFDVPGVALCNDIL